ncbi:hypothetical protein [Alkaliphilus hydrothermalis]|uniref:Uncharacterized protein n=1 Tax=Alkaliphilus hydrothermalis TaxID=1482730 RepID=A0ABS2NT70_9FIRM|nr:hypothetical protein [Alkaliphilus hydrothermalis]MBM7616147.1 hypothetical protein [Alkaliphilus hydrothermalis]
MIKCFPIKLNVDEAKNIANKKGNFIGKVLLKNHNEITMKELYIENKVITYNVTFTPLPFVKKLFKNYKQQEILIRIIANGSTGGVSYYDDKGIDIETKEVNPDNIQMSDYDIEKLITKGNILVRKILRRRIGGNLTINAVDVMSVFRPYHIAFFGELIEGSKVRYIPISADGCNVRRTF